MQEILNHIDQFYQENQYEEAYQYMLTQLEEAMTLNRDDIVLGLLSELMGYYRVRAEFQLGNQMAQQAIKIILGLGLENSVEGATTYLNIATLYRVQGLYKTSLDYYQKALKIYQDQIDESDERFISLYNNLSLLYQETNDLNQALDYEIKALSLINNKENCEIETAITYTNLSQMYFQLNQRDQGLSTLTKAIELFETYAPNDPHYFAAMASLAQSYYMIQDYDKALDIYKQVLSLIEGVYGQNKDYQTVYQNYLYIQSQIKSHGFGLSLSRSYYQDIGLPMLEEKFPDLLPYMAIGLVGMGSECLGYDDEISQDHDFGPGFCIWLPQDIYVKYAHRVQDAYLQLNPKYQGYERLSSSRGEGRVGVFQYDDFYLQHLGIIPKTLKEWLKVDENALLMMTSGEVFRDDFGEFTRIRQLLHYYPEDIRVKKIVKTIAKMAQSGQYNYARCMKRHDIFAAELAIHEFINETLSCVYLLNQTYKPYYKWVYKGMERLEKLRGIDQLLKDLMMSESQILMWQSDSPQMNLLDKKVVLVEKICQMIIHELYQQGLSTNQDDFLENHVNEVMSHIKDDDIRHMHIMEE